MAAQCSQIQKFTFKVFELQGSIFDAQRGRYGGSRNCAAEARPRWVRVGG
jgi:hypothetical protein